MENDSVRTIGENTLVDLWIDGRIRSISVSRQAIAAFLQGAGADPGDLSEEDRREFVRSRMSLIVAAAKDVLRRTGSDAANVAIEADQLRHGPRERGGDRRKGDRRQGDRRKANLGPPPGGERRKR